MFKSFLKFKNILLERFIRKERNNLYKSLSHINQLRFEPKTIFDIGVAKGTSGLYKAYPKSFFVLIDPLEQYKPYMEKILKKYNGIFKLCAVSDKNETRKFNLHPNHMDGSSLLKEESGREIDGYEIEVTTRIIDDIVIEENLKGPFLLKIDVQGAELQVLKGAENTLKNTEIIALEVSLFKFMKGGPDFFEIISFMKGYGFVTYDILKSIYRPLDNALAQVDIVFVKENGRFRKDHRFATSNQMASMGLL